MIDITNKTAEDINNIVQKYIQLLELLKPKEQVAEIAFVFDKAINYIKEKYNELSVDWKSYILLFIKLRYFNNKINTEEDIIKEIDDLVNHYNTYYNNYVDSLAMSASDYDRDLAFMKKYL